MDNSRKAAIAQLLAMGGGVYYAYTKKSSVWGYMGYGFLFSVVGGIIARRVFNVSVWTQSQSQLPPPPPPVITVKDVEVRQAK
jgi:hypothetical protein